MKTVRIQVVRVYDVKATSIQEVEAMQAGEIEEVGELVDVTTEVLEVIQKGKT